jgi:hypothetical protein
MHTADNDYRSCSRSYGVGAGSRVGNASRIQSSHRIEDARRTVVADVIVCERYGSNSCPLQSGRESRRCAECVILAHRLAAVGQRDFKITDAEIAFSQSRLGKRQRVAGPPVERLLSNAATKHQVAHSRECKPPACSGIVRSGSRGSRRVRQGTVRISSVIRPVPIDRERLGVQARTVPRKQRHSAGLIGYGLQEGGGAGGSGSGYGIKTLHSRNMIVEPTEKAERTVGTADLAPARHAARKDTLRLLR